MFKRREAVATGDCQSDQHRVPRLVGDEKTVKGEE